MQGDLPAGRGNDGGGGNRGPDTEGGQVRIISGEAPGKSKGKKKTRKALIKRLQPTRWHGKKGHSPVNEKTTQRTLTPKAMAIP